MVTPLGFVWQISLIIEIVLDRLLCIRHGILVVATVAVIHFPCVSRLVLKFS